MLQARFAEIAVDPSEVEESGSYQRHNLRILRECDRAYRRAFAVRDIERVPIGAQRKSARLCHRGRSCAPVTQTFLARARERRDSTAVEIEHANLMSPRVREEQLVAFLLEIPGRRQCPGAGGLGGAELPPALARSGESRHRTAREIDAPNRMILRVG